MNSADNLYLQSIICKYEPRTLHFSTEQLLNLYLQEWANAYFLNINNISKSGSIAKNTAISLGSDFDVFISLSYDSDFSLKEIYQSLISYLQNKYQKVRAQNVSARIILDGVNIDVTPARKQSGNTHYHDLWVSKKQSKQQTNIVRHINDILNSNRTNEIKLLKIWRELNKLDFPSIYLEYLTIRILSHKYSHPAYLYNNFSFLLTELAKANDNPLLLERIIDPANSTNILSGLLIQSEKDKIRKAAYSSISKQLTKIIY